MSDIFISYKREEQAIARKLADALEGEGWTVWWDPKLRAGERFDDVIEKALNEAKCVIVMWSNLSVNSEYVKAEATEALEQNKLVPIKIENVGLPFRFKRVHTLSLLGWGGSKNLPEFRTLIRDITAIVGSPVTKRQEAQPANGEENKLEPGTIFRDKLKGGSQGPEMVVVPAGTFKMGDIRGTGDRDEKPVHAVSIPKPFAIGRYPITFDEYDQFASTTGHPSPDDLGWGRGRQPVINVSWDDAVEYAKWLCEQTGKRYRLPTEAEWEYAARAGTETDYWWGNEMKFGMANCKGGDIRWGEKQTSPVGSFLPNPFGLYDTAGNVLELVEDCWHENYEGAPTDGSAWLEAKEGDCGQRVARGGAYILRQEFSRASNRSRSEAAYRVINIGFRLVQDVD